MTSVSGAWLDDAGTQAVLGVLTSTGAGAYLVGGCVRNALLGVPVGDIDIATDARPDRVTELARAAGLRVIPTGIDHGTVTVLAHGGSFEVTTFRRDVATDGRRAVVAFADDIAQDAMRRDFTMNALYARADGRVIDPLGGLPDLQARRVRFIGEAADRIREDYLRSLRYFRFHALYGDPDAGFDPEALAGIAGNLDGVEALSRERIGAEMLKLLAAPDPAPSLATMQQCGLLMRCLPGAESASLAPLVHLEGQAGVAPDPIRRLAALGGQDAGAALRLSKAQQRVLTTLRQGIEQGLSNAECAYRHGADVAISVALLQGALFSQPLHQSLQAQIALGAQATFPIRAADLADRFQGKALGDHLKRLERAWIASDFSMDRSALLNL